MLSGCFWLSLNSDIFKTVGTIIEELHLENISLWETGFPLKNCAGVVQVYLCTSLDIALASICHYF